VTTPNDPAVLRVGPWVGRDDVAGLCDRLTAIVAERPGAVVVCDVSAVAQPDAVTVEALARLQLTARRLGRDLRIRGVDRRLRMLIAFVGLADALAVGDVPFGGSDLVEPGRKAEEREDPLGVEEVVDPGDLPA
jgi:ABC-type transporter Mla MlaB component